MKIETMKIETMDDVYKAEQELMDSADKIQDAKLRHDIKRNIARSHLASQKGIFLQIKEQWKPGQALELYDPLGRI